MAFKFPAPGRYDHRRGCFIKSREAGSPYYRNGVPDIIAVIEGRFVGFEVKSEKGSQSPAQKDFESDLRLIGKAFYYLVRSIEDVEDALDDFESRIKPEST